MTNDEPLSKKRRLLSELMADDVSSDEEEALAPAQDMKNYYLETVKRSRLDFDFIKICSISLSSVNVYCCLVCGKYLQGRGKSSYAFSHSINDDHHIFINLQSLKTYILPENYEIVDSSLDDVKYLINPTYDKALVRNLYKSKDIVYDLNKEPYRPGFVGMNSSNDSNDYANVIIQLLGHVNPLRDTMLLQDKSPKDLIEEFSLTVRKMWSSRLFKSHISPHALLQLIFKESGKKFSMDSKSDPRAFLVWFLNSVAVGLTKDGKKSILNRIFQGKLALDDDKVTKFWLLSVDLPHYSLFQNKAQSEEIPQVDLSAILAAKFANKIQTMPPTLIVHINRFQNSNMRISSVSGSTTNPTVVKFPLQMDFSPLTKDKKKPCQYKLIANVVHELVPLAQLENNDTDKDNWKIQLLDKVRNEWLEIHDLKIQSVQKEMLFLSESYIQFWERVDE